MNRPKVQHSVQSASTLLLFFLYVLFLLPVLIMSAGAYRKSVEGQERGHNLYTASGYITAKFRSYDTEVHRIQTGFLGEFPALMFNENLEGKEYTTYLYLDGKELKELFTESGSAASAGMGTTIAFLDAFSVKECENGLYAFLLTDEQGYSSRFMLHSGPPDSERWEGS